MKYQFYSDGGHGWIKVSIDELKKLGIHEKISNYSYMKNGYAYLEEDCDLSLFFKAKGFTDFDKVVNNNRQSDKQSKIRNYQTYNFNTYQNQEDLIDRFNEDSLFRLWTLKIINQESKSNMDFQNYSSYDDLMKNGKAWFLHLADNLINKIKNLIEIDLILWRSEDNPICKKQKENLEFQKEVLNL